MIWIPCNLCGQDDWQVLFPATMENGDDLDVGAFRCTNPGYGHHLQIVKCNHCDYVYANPRWSDEEILEAYTAVEDETYVVEREGRELTFRRHLDRMEALTGPANGRSLLDVGAYIGVFVETATKAGWDAYGVEPSEWGAKEAQRHGLNVIQGTLDAPELAGRQFDVITMWDVIEHFNDPSLELAKSYRLLPPGGWIAIHTMDIDSAAARLMGRRWPWLMDMHLHYFSQKTLAKMLIKNGFEVIWSGAQGRYLSLRYLATRLGGLHGSLGQATGWMFEKMRVEEVEVPVNMGDLFTVYARRK